MNGPDYIPPRHIVVEGPIRVGKSTLARALAEKLHARRIFDCEGEENPFLADFYDEKPGAAFKAQMHFLYERHRRLLETRPEDSAAPVVCDFLFEKDKIFAYINLDNEELKLYEKYFDMLAPSVAPPDLVIYLQATPAVLSKRVSKKADPGRRKSPPSTWKRSPTLTSTSSFAIHARIYWSWTRRKSTSWNAMKICRSYSAACASR
jgi:deoxyguanosine kinase